MDDAVKKAMEKFDVPTGHEEFLFIFPLLYVAKADGSLSLKEAYKVMWSAMTSLTPPKGKEEQKVLQDFLKEQVTVFKAKKTLPDSEILTNAINAILSQYSSDQAKATRKAMYDSCLKVAKTSGPMFREKVSEAERNMLDSLFSDIQEPK